jgi:hypothetical protein
MTRWCGLSRSSRATEPSDLRRGAGRKVTLALPSTRPLAGSSGGVAFGHLAASCPAQARPWGRVAHGSKRPAFGSPPGPAPFELAAGTPAVSRSIGGGLEPDSSISPQEIRLEPFAGQGLPVAGRALKVGLPRQAAGLVPARRQLDHAHRAVPCVDAAATTHIPGCNVRKHVRAAVVHRHGVWGMPLPLCSQNLLAPRTAAPSMRTSVRGLARLRLRSLPPRTRQRQRALAAAAASAPNATRQTRTSTRPKATMSRFFRDASDDPRPDRGCGATVDAAR